MMSRTIVITGASSGIGLALAKDYAKEGHRLALTGRDQKRLDETASACRQLGAKVTAAVLDVRDRSAMQDWLVDLDRQYPVDLLIANTGILRGSPDGKSPESNEDSLTLMETNVLGLVNTVHPLLPRMIARQRGQIAVMSSIAGLIPLSWCPSYAASKAAAYSYGMSLRDPLCRHGVFVSVICAGFIDTPMTGQLHGRRPREMAAKDASARIRKGLEQKKALIAFPAALAYGARLLAVLPLFVRQRLAPILAVNSGDKK